MRRGLALALIVFGLGAVQVQAQTSYNNLDADGWQRLETQLTRSIQSDVSQVREDAIRNLIFFAENFPNDVGFSEAAYDIMGQFETTEDVSERLLALAALNAIGETYTIKRLAEIASAETSPKVRSMTNAVLRAHFASL